MKLYSVNCQLTDEHVSKEKIPARTLDVRSTQHWVSRGIAWADESYKGGEVWQGPSSDAEYPKAHRWHKYRKVASADVLLSAG